MSKDIVKPNLSRLLDSFLRLELNRTGDKYETILTHSNIIQNNQCTVSITCLTFKQLKSKFSFILIS